MKLNTKALRYLNASDWRTLTAVETGSRKHEVVPTPVIVQLAKASQGDVQRSICVLAKANLIAKVKNAKYDGYRLTYGGLDYLALHSLQKARAVYSVGNQIGVGKESDIFVVSDDKGEQRVLKIHRLGRVSFKKGVRNKRDYARTRAQKERAAGSWMYMSRLAAVKEHAFMAALHEAGLSVPRPLGQNRHQIVMSLVDGFPLRQIEQVADPAALYAELMDMIIALAHMGLIHGDFNEFNIMIKEEEARGGSGADDVQLVPVLIDFPQMISVDHSNAEMYFDRDVACVKRFFERRFGFVAESQGPFFHQVKKGIGQGGGRRRLDVQVEASGFSKKMAKELDAYMAEHGVDGDAGSRRFQADASGLPSGRVRKLRVEGEKLRHHPTPPQVSTGLDLERARMRASPLAWLVDFLLATTPSLAGRHWRSEAALGDQRPRTPVRALLAAAIPLERHYHHQPRRAPPASPPYHHHTLQRESAPPAYLATPSLWTRSCPYCASDRRCHSASAVPRGLDALPLGHAIVHRRRRSRRTRPPIPRSRRCAGDDDPSSSTAAALRGAGAAMMLSSPPGSPDVARQRPQSMYTAAAAAASAACSPEPASKSRPQSMMFRSPRSQSRLSQSSKQAVSRMSDDDAKTSVKVVVRVRPPLGPSDPGYDLIPQRFQRSMVQVATPTSLGVDSPQGRRLFFFDHVFDQTVSQKGVWEYLHDSVDSFLQGYNVSILAYGQSGSGKSYTMGTSGPAEQRDASLKGVIPRAAQHLFDSLEAGGGSGQAHARQNSGIKAPTRFSVAAAAAAAAASSVAASSINAARTWEMSITYVEIYNEQPRDLLLSEALPSFERANVQIREDAKGRIFVEGLTSVPVHSIDELLSVLNRGSTIRQTDATAINDRSKLHFVDLAGSERLKNTGATGSRAREGININAGLAALGKVISQLSSRSAPSHVSYRDSKLTRMLQDSLGGSAITYMIACVTPAEFHLSETLNTVQYATRARNIQIKPKIQHIQDDANKQALIDRLRTERMNRPTERETELQNQLLDVQESYGTLSQRHAKLIAELTQANDNDSQVPQIAGESAVDRLKRSQAHQRQIEQMVLEYETTIQSLETNLSNTRSSLAATESNLLERETKCAYVETVNQQLNNRVQKLIDRESSMEQYLRDLEARLQHTDAGGQKSDALASDLRREIARIRESESNAEDYICTLEERLAEADQDVEILQRQVDRLERLVERQRGLGRLDSLLCEFDQSHQRQAKPDVAHANGLGKELPALPEDPEGVELAGDAVPDTTAPSASPRSLLPDDTDPRPNPAQTQFMAEKFEAVSNELFELRLEHEQTSNELDLMSAKYHEALRTLARMQDSLGESPHPSANMDTALDTALRHTPPRDSFLEDGETRTLKDGQALPSLRSLSSELSSAAESPATTDTDITPVSKQPASGEVATKEIKKLQTLLAEHERGMSEVTELYTQLQIEHRHTLSTVEKLKSDISKARPVSPATTLQPGMFRRIAPQLGLNGVDKGQRSITAIRSFVAEELDGQPDKLEAAETHLSAASHELQFRFERIQALEAELKATKREMDMKTTIISGLARERNSVQAGSSVDLSIVSQLRDQLIQKETELKSAGQQSARECESQLSSAKWELNSALTKMETLKAQLAAPEGDAGFQQVAMSTAMQHERENYEDLISDLKEALADQHKQTASQTTKIEELVELQSSLSQDALRLSAELRAKNAQLEAQTSRIVALEQELERANSQLHAQNTSIATLHESHRSSSEEMKLSHAAVLAAYDDQLADAKAKYETLLGHHDATTAANADAKTVHVHQLIKQVEPALGHATSADLLVGHIQDLVQEKQHVSEALARVNSTNQELERQLAHTHTLTELEDEVKDLSSKIANYQETIRSLANEVGNHEDTIRAKSKLIEDHEATISALKEDHSKKATLIEELEQQLQNSFDQHNNRISVITATGNQALLEAQQRIALLEREVDQRRSYQDSDGSRSNTMKSIQRPQSPLSDANNRSNSLSSNLRKSASIASIPSPPPAIPLPPIPSIPGIANGVTAPGQTSSPPQSRHASKEVTAVPLPVSASATPSAHPASPVSQSFARDTSATALRRQSALIEEQEARLRTVEKHLYAEKQLTATLEEALVDLETQSNKLRADAEVWKKKAWAMEEEVGLLRKEKRSERMSVLAMEEEVRKRREAEAARAQLEERMRLLNETSSGRKKKKGGGLNCF
ncbi:hypothetical protein DV737_g533, partial [Chaetothyriales sp. CBS 132003]